MQYTINIHTIYIQYNAQQHAAVIVDYLISRVHLQFLILPLSFLAKGRIFGKFFIGGE